MPLSVGSHKLSPDNATLRVRTKKAGAAAAAGHDLLIEVCSWNATVKVGEDGVGSSAELSADSRSLKVIEGSGGITKLGDDDKAGIAQTIDEEVLKGSAIEFRSTNVAIDGDREQLRVEGQLELAGQRHPVAFQLTATGGRLAGSATIKQTGWGIKPYSALFGTLKVIDEVTVELVAELPPDTGH